MQRIKRETCPFVDLPVNLKLKFFYDYVGRRSPHHRAALQLGG
jgi:hypothetical protein